MDKRNQSNQEKTVNSDQILTKNLKLDTYLGILLIIFAILLSGVAFIFIMMFGGEFLIVAQNEWLLYVFVGLLIGGSIYCLYMTRISKKSGRLRGLLIDKISNEKLRLVWLFFWALWNILVSVLLFLIFRMLYLGSAEAMPSFLIVILAIPFFGYGVVLIGGTIKFLQERFRFKREARLMRGLTAGGIAFLFIFGSFGSIMAFWNPNWTSGIQRQTLFTGNIYGAGYRIPALITLPGDIMLAFSESRKDVMADWGDIDIVMRRSLDGGDTWGTIQVLQDRGKLTVHNPCPLFDNNTQVLFLPFCVEYGRIFIMNSTNLGVSWSEPRELTQDIGAEGLCCATGPGNGIQMSNGRLIIPAEIGGACVIYSDDNGISWQKGALVGKGEEPQVFESANGSLVINCRAERGGYRIMAWSNNGGQDWEPYYYEEDLPAAGTQGSIFRFTNTSTHMQSRVLFSNPNRFSRGHFTIRMSYDEGLTWNVSKQVYEGPSAYSSIAILSDYTICVLFETGKYDYRESITLIKIDINWLTDGLDVLVPK
ncbi:MAG: exo-alpha-sialidase [Candidatus Thorarchaeota archaeon]